MKERTQMNALTTHAHSLSQWISEHKTEQGQKGPDAAAVQMGGREWRMEGAWPTDWICKSR